MGSFNDPPDILPHVERSGKAQPRAPQLGEGEKLDRFSKFEYNRERRIGNLKGGLLLLKRVMLYLMMLMTAYKGISLVVRCVSDFGRLPAAVYISTGLVVLLGIFLSIRHLVSYVPNKLLELYYCVGAVSVVLNLVFMRLFTRVDVTLLDFLVIGTVMDILVDVVLVGMALRESRYISIKVR